MNGIISEKGQTSRKKKRRLRIAAKGEHMDEKLQTNKPMYL